MSKNEKALNLKQVQDTDKIINIKDYDLTDTDKFLTEWKDDFISRMQLVTKSKKRNFTYYDAVQCKSFITDPLDKLLIDYFRYIRKNPLKDNDYFKYVNSYIKGKKLDDRYFRHDLDKLHEYYKKIDDQRKENKDAPILIFSETAWKRYVLFMMLKFSGLYSKKYDKMFHVKIQDHREYNPLTNLPSVFRSIIPFKVKEYDISRAFPSFIFMELGMKPFDVYERLNKSKFNMLLNVHKDSKNADIDNVRKQLKPIYGNRVDEVITEERFNNKGQTFRDFAKYEEKYINKFIKANKLKNYVRLHDSITVLYEEKCEKLSFDDLIHFKEKEFPQSEIRPDAKKLFYEFDEDGFCQIRPSLVSDFFIQEGYIRISKAEKDELMIIKNDNKVISLFNVSTDTDGFLTKNINEFNPDPVKDAITRNTNQIRQSYKLLPAEEWKLQRDTKDSVYLPFKNGVLKVTKDETELIPYESDEIGFFMKVESMNHEFSQLKGGTKSDFEIFLTNAIIGRRLDNDGFYYGEEDKLTAFHTMIGYLISNYKNPSMNPAIILSDEGADDTTRNGRRGKTLITKGIAKFRVMAQKGGKEFDGNYRHNFAELEEYHDFYRLDDIPANFNFDDLYTNISGDISVQRKGTKAENIPFEMTPKFVITTNWSVRYDPEADSTNARFIEYQLTNFWNIKNSPLKHFGYNFFTEWNPDQWNEFFNFIVDCVQAFLNYGIKSIQYDKREDNYKANFNNDAKIEEFERLFNIVSSQPDGFTVFYFLKLYNQADNPLRSGKYFDRWNTKKLIDAYIKYHELDFKYLKDQRKWKKK